MSLEAGGPPSISKLLPDLGCLVRVDGKRQIGHVLIGFDDLFISRLGLENVLDVLWLHFRAIFSVVLRYQGGEIALPIITVRYRLNK